MKKIQSRTWQGLILGLTIMGILVLALSGYLNQIIGKTIDPVISVQSWFSTRLQAIVEFMTIPRDVASLREENSSLTNQVSQLQAQVLELKQQLTETDILYALLGFARTRPENKYVAASVIGRDPSPFLNYIIIDHGSDDGILKGMPVITQQGLVGRVAAVTATAARVQLISDSGSVVNVRLENAKTDAQVLGSVTGDITLDMVNPNIDLIQGDIVLTSGLGGAFPTDILVGQVLTPQLEENALFKSATLQPAVDFVTLRAVLIITNFKPVNITPLIPN